MRHHLLSTGVLLFSTIAAAGPGTEFWAVSSRDDTFLDLFAVAVCNPAAAGDARIEIDTEAGPLASRTVPPSSCQLVLERMDRAANNTVLAQLAYRITSDVPVFVQQYVDFSFSSGDSSASMLPDRSMFGSDYFVHSLQAHTFEWRPSVVTIVAPQQARVDVTVASDTKAGLSVPALVAGQTFTADLPPFGVLQIASVPGGDMTGSQVRSDVPVEVFGGCFTCFLPGTTGDKIQEWMLPIDAWGKTAVAAASLPSTGASNVWRILAVNDGTVVATDPALPGTPATVDRGKFLQLASDFDFFIDASMPVLVGRLETRAPNIDDDPALCLMLPEERFSAGGTFSLPDRWNQVKHWLDVVARSGTNVVVDGTAVPATSFSAVGGSGFVHASIPLAFTGTHTVSADAPIAAYAGAFISSNGISFPVDIGCGSAVVPPEISRVRSPLWLARRGPDVLFSWEDLGGPPLIYHAYAGTIRSIWDHLPLACALAGSPISGARREAIVAVPSNRYLLMSAASCAGEGESGADPARSTCPP